jgi:hypoxanthine phosphoribosyltransferase
MNRLFGCCMTFVSLFSSLPALEEIQGSDVSPFDYPLDLLISYPEIVEKIQQLGAQLEQDYAHEEVCLLAVLKGSLWFATDLMKSLKIPVTINTIQCSSYGNNGTVSGKLTITGVESLDLQGKHVLIVDDICDTGQTLIKLKEKLQSLGPKSLKTAVLLVKKNDRSLGYAPDYSLFRIEDRFVVGYGLDYKEYYRGLPGIYVLGYDDISLGES